MNVIKRNGEQEAVNLNKITERLKKLKTLNDSPLEIDEIKVASKVIAGLYDGVTTQELDVLAAETAAMMSTIHPDYDTLAARLTISNLHKETSGSFIKKTEQLFKIGILSKEYYDFIRDNSGTITSLIDYNRDYTFDYFGTKTLQKSYLLKDKEGKIIERPQDMWMRVSAFVHMREKDFVAIKETYDLLSNKYFTHATPTLFNSGTIRPQLSSCFLLDINSDSIDGIYKTLADCAKISQSAGGIGLSIHKIRGAGSYINGTNGISNGVVPMLRVFDATARYVDQGGGKRKGSIAVYVEPWHSDIFEFLDLKKNHGKEELRARDLFYAMWIPDLFMKRVEEDKEWSLFDPAQAYVEIENKKQYLYDLHSEEFELAYGQLELAGKAKKVIQARELWEKILANQIETGVPYILYKDAANKKSNQSNLGTIKSSNLCVTGDTKLLTSTGYWPIKDLHGKRSVSVWNGKKWSDTSVIKTGINQKILEIKTTSGSTIKCTHYHKFYSKDGSEVRAIDLNVGDKLLKFHLPVIDEGKWLNYAYADGFFAGDGNYTYDGLYPRIELFGPKKALVNEFILRPNSTAELNKNSNTITVRPELDPVDKFFVPINYRLRTKILWLAGLLDSDGTTNKWGANITSTKEDFLINVKYLLNTLSVDCKISLQRGSCLKKCNNHEFISNPVFQLNISQTGISRLSALGLNTKRLLLSKATPDKCLDKYIKVVSIKEIAPEDTFCVNEPLEHKVIFNGLLTGQCAEIIEYTDESEIAVCNLASISLPAYIKDGGFNYDKLYEVTKVITRNLNKVIDANYYPVKESKTSNLKHRPIGIGVQGLADVFAALQVPFDSAEAKNLNSKIFEVIYKGAIDSSIELARIYGPYESFKDSPASNGRLQFDLWGINRDNLKLSWESTLENLRTYGLRNSLLTCEMPTASTSQILGNNEAFEPFTSNIYTRRTLAGEFIVVNKHLIRDLIKIGVWDEKMRQQLITANGSIQNLSSIPKEIRDRYKTVWEISQKIIIDMAADRGPFICQSQSMNIFMETPTLNKLNSMHFYGWKKSLKTGMYYLRSQAATQAIQFTVVKENKDNEENSGGLYAKPPIEPKQKEETNYGGDVCIIGDDGCISCGS